MNDRHKGICEGCKWARAHWCGACECEKYGIVIGYPKQSCGGRERDEIPEQDNTRGRDDV